MPATIYNAHHCLWKRNCWDTGWARRLRNHPYCRIEIPRDTLHQLIHATIPEIPVASGIACKTAYEALNSWLEAEFISMDDNLSTRCANLMRCFRASSPDTYKALQKQKQIADGYYHKTP